MPIRILMLGWEFPPFINGGLGAACHGLVVAMQSLNVDITMLLPATTSDLNGVEQAVMKASLSPQAEKANVVFRHVPYKTPNPYSTAPAGSRRRTRILGTGSIGGYDGNLAGRVYEYAKLCCQIVETDSFDVIHAHDWVTFPAGLALAAKFNKPLVLHVHATEIDRSGQCLNQAVYEIERDALQAASLVIAVSNYTARILIEHYGVPPEKIRVVHNGIAPSAVQPPAEYPEKRGKKTVLFLGRITWQKGPEYFVEAADQIRKQLPNVRFIIAGWGDMGPAMVERVAAKRLGSRIFFAGFLRGRDVDRAYSMADAFIMPSVSEPFGLTALEAIQHGVPVILSKNTGVGEVLRRGALKVDFWDTNKIASSTIEVLSDPTLAANLRQNAKNEIENITWSRAAEKCLDVYRQVTNTEELVPVLI